jgi:hypothetical protein
MVRELHAEFLVDAFFSIDVVFDHQRPGQNIIRQRGRHLQPGHGGRIFIEENPGPIPPASILNQFLSRVRNILYSLRSESKRIWILFASYLHVSV